MKRIKDIENLSIEELENLPEIKQIPVPEGLAQRMAAALTAQELSERKPRSVRWIPYTALSAAAAAAAAVIMLLSPAPPRDTFEDPALAYAEVEKTFQYISQKMSAGVGMAREAKSAADKPSSIISKINSK